MIKPRQNQIVPLSQLQAEVAGIEQRYAQLIKAEEDGFATAAGDYEQLLIELYHAATVLNSVLAERSEQVRSLLQGYGSGEPVESLE